MSSEMISVIPFGGFQVVWERIGRIPREFRMIGLCCDVTPHTFKATKAFILQLLGRHQSLSFEGTGHAQGIGRDGGSLSIGRSRRWGTTAWAVMSLVV